MFDSSDKGIMLKAIMVAAPILLCMGLLPVLSFYIEKMEENGRAQIVEYIAIAQAAMEVKFDAADLNGWQTGYAFDIVRNIEGASHDDAISRSEFLRSADNFRRDIQTLRGMALSATSAASWTACSGISTPSWSGTATSSPCTAPATPPSATRHPSW